MPYSQDQRVWLVENYFVTQNASHTSRLFGQHFNLPHPSPQTVLSLVEKFRTTGSVQNLPRTRNPSVLTPACVDDIQEIFTDHPNTSIRQAAAVLNISIGSVHNALKSLGLHPYKAINVQQLLPGDNQQRVQFCNGFDWACQNLQTRGGDFHDNIFWTDESIVRLTSRENPQNFRTWSFENPYVRVQIPTYPEQLHIWAAICSAGVIGPYFFDGGVTAQRYIQMLDQYFWPIINRMPGRQNMFFMQDGATPHFALQTRDWLNLHFPNRWIGRAGPMSWPPRSPDLTPADFFLWPYLKEKIRRSAPQDITELRQAILQECAAIPREMCENACRSVLDRCNRCVQNAGGHF